MNQQRLSETDKASLRYRQTETFRQTMQDLETDKARLRDRQIDRQRET